MMIPLESFEIVSRFTEIAGNADISPIKKYQSRSFFNSCFAPGPDILILSPITALDAHEDATPLLSL